MTEQQAKRKMADTLEKYFSQRLMAPLAEREKEAETNKQFHLGDKSFEYVVTLAGHEPRCWWCDERLDYC